MRRWRNARQSERPVPADRPHEAQAFIGLPRQSQNLTHWSDLSGPESPGYQPRAKMIPRAERRP
jgi:hypothetical protein